MSNERQFVYHLSDWILLHQVLNEVVNGFALSNFAGVIGMSKSELKQLLTYLHGLPKDADVSLNLEQAMAFRNALRETIRELRIEEFHTRTGFDFEFGKATLEELDRLIADNH